MDGISSVAFAVTPTQNQFLMELAVNIAHKANQIQQSQGDAALALLDAAAVATGTTGKGQVINIQA